MLNKLVLLPSFIEFANLLGEIFAYFKLKGCYEGESIKNQPNLFLGEIDLFFFDVIAL